MNEPELAPAVTDDRLLGGRIQLMQPQEGYRVAIDPVFLAAAVPAGPGDLVLDVGAGVGAAALCLAWREQGCQIRGIEVQRDLVRLAAHNVDVNGFAGRVEIMIGDLSGRRRAGAELLPPRHGQSAVPAAGRRDAAAAARSRHRPCGG
jgi:tRNA1(Val) A37 N6-methylase TrmN6